MVPRTRGFDTNPKQQILLKAKGKKFRLSSGVALPFWREQPKALGQNAECQLELTIAQDFKKRMLFSEAVQGAASSSSALLQALATKDSEVTVKDDHSTVHGLTRASASAVGVLGVRFPVFKDAIAAYANAAIDTNDATGLYVSIENIYLNLSLIVPRAPIPRPLSTQYSFNACTLLTRSLSTSTDFTETFVVPISTRMFVCAWRDPAVSLNIDNEDYVKGVLVQNFSLQRGSEILPMPSYNCRFDEFNPDRALADYNKAIGATTVNAKGGRDLLSYCEEPLFVVPSTNEESSTNVTIRFTTKSALSAEMLVYCYHTRVLELTVTESGVPQSTVTDQLVQ